MNIQHPAYTDAVERGEPSHGPNDEPIADDGTIEVDDDADATALMDQLAKTYGVEYDDDGSVTTDVTPPPTPDELEWDPQTVSGVGPALAGRIAAENDIVADVLTGAEDQQPEELLAEIDGIDLELANEIVDSALDAGAGGVREASIRVLAPDERADGGSATGE